MDWLIWCMYGTNKVRGVHEGLCIDVLWRLLRLQTTSSTFFTRRRGRHYCRPVRPSRRGTSPARTRDQTRLCVGVALLGLTWPQGYCICCEWVPRYHIFLLGMILQRAVIYHIISYHIISYHIKFTHNTTLEHMQTTYISNKSKCVWRYRQVQHVYT